MSAPTFAGSRSEEIDAMIREIASGLGDGSPHFAAPAAGTDGTEAVDAPDVAAGEIRVNGSGLRDDVDAVEHLRQNRLRRWQKPADPIK